MHGGQGWTIQYPDGRHKHAYPGGHIRKISNDWSIDWDSVKKGIVVGGGIFFGLVYFSSTGDSSMLQNYYAY